jgi:hypothetical protein
MPHSLISEIEIKYIRSLVNKEMRFGQSQLNGE